MSNDAENGGNESGGPVDDRSAFAKAMDLATQVTTICLMLVFPALAGFFLDRWLGWGVVLTSLGLLVGLGISGLQLVRLVRRLERNSESKPNGNKTLRQ
jgi:hypothetical protein